MATDHRPSFSLSLALHKFASLLNAPVSRVFQVVVDGVVLGFAITYLIRSGAASNAASQHLKGSLALLAVHPAHQNRGVGVALHTAAWQHLEGAVRASLTLSTPRAVSTQLQLGSIFSRIFPGLPEGERFEHAYNWFRKRGWPFAEDVSIDLYRPVSTSYEVISRITHRPSSFGIRFGVLQEADDEGLFAFHNSAFGAFTGWPDLFPALIEAGRREDLWCAFDSQGKILAATIAAMPPKTGERESPIHRNLAWPYTIGIQCAAIACVGVADTATSTGVGLAMMTTALKHLADRGADGCFVDWVSMKGWYRKVGFEK